MHFGIHRWNEIFKPYYNLNIQKYMKLYIGIVFSLFNISVSAQITFGPHFQIQNAGIISYCVADDFNNDGLTDLITASKGRSVYLLWIYKQQNGQLVFQDTMKYNRTVFQGMENMASGDLNNDGLKDLVITYADTVKVYFQDSLSGFFNSTDFIVLCPDTNYTIHGLAHGDLNNDGLCDIAVSTWINTATYPSNVYVYYQSSNHSFALSSYYKIFNYKNEVIIADMDNDGLNDLIVSNGGTYSSHGPTPGMNCFAIYLQDSMTNSLQYPRFYAIDTITPNRWILNMVSGIAVGDIDNDGYNDIVTSYEPGPNAYLWHNIPGNPDLFPNQPDSLGTDINPTAVYINDLNNDGKNEIIINSDGYERVSIFESDSTYQFSNYYLVNIWNGSNMEQQMLSVCDLNNDSLLDIAATYSYGVSIIYNSTINSISDIGSSNQYFVLYPSPANDYFELKINETVSDAQLEIYDLMGKKVLDQIINSSNEIIKTTSLTSQLYLVKFLNHGKVFLGKLVIQRK